MSGGLAKIYAILGERYETGETDLAARHDEYEDRVQVDGPAQPRGERDHDGLPRRTGPGRTDGRRRAAPACAAG